MVTQDDIKRSGARNIPEALRLVPGLDVAQIDASEWAVSARGFNDQSANKLLVLQDGRSIYTPLFSGVFWDVQDTMMEDIDHIEVVRGPGATVWGENAMNGVINIITKSAEDTQGWLVTGGGGTLERGFADVRYGGKIGDNAYYRVYGTYSDHAGADLPDGTEATNSWQMARGGFRVDWECHRTEFVHNSRRRLRGMDSPGPRRFIQRPNFRRHTPNQFRMTGKCMAPMCWAAGRTRFPTRPI